MECQSSDSKKLTKVFDATQRKRSKKKRDGFDDNNSVATDDSAIGCLQKSLRPPSEKASMPEISVSQSTHQDINLNKRREGLSLALKAGLVSTPRSASPYQDGDCNQEALSPDQDSFIYTFLEEAIKRDKKKQRHARRREQRRSHEREESTPRERERDKERDRSDRHRHHHRHRDDVPSRDNEKSRLEVPIDPLADKAVFFETFAKMCAQLNEQSSHHVTPETPVIRTLSHKSLQCEVRREGPVDDDRQPVRLSNHIRSRELVATKIRSHENCCNRGRSQEKTHPSDDMDRSKPDKNSYYYDKESQKYGSKLDVSRSRPRHADDERYRGFGPTVVPARSCLDPYKRSVDRERDYREFDRVPRGLRDPRDFRDSRGRYEDDRRKYCEQKTSRSFDIQQEYHDDERMRRTARSDAKERRFDERDRRYDDRDKRYDERDKRYDDRDRRFDDAKYYDRDRLNMSSRDRRWRKNLERFERTSVVSRDDEERERDSGLSVADGDTSTLSGRSRSNYLKIVKQQITEQREAMDKMMSLWKELMRCFKGISPNQGPDKSARESAANVRESATEQMRLWWECMRRYETVARDVGDTDARLMEEIKKQRSEMAEMATMWQECLQRYRDISTDFNNLKQQLKKPESPTRQPAAPILCAEGEGTAVPYRMPPAYPPVIQHGAPLGGAGGGYGRSPPRGRSSAPPAWWWCEGQARSPRRRSSPESRASRNSRERDKDRRHRHKDRDDSRYKDKPSKPSAARSEHRHRKR